MRLAVLLAVLLAAACGQGAPSGPTAGARGGPALVLTRDALVGVWSFDRTCASEDALMLQADGSAALDLWGQGSWTISERGDRIVLTLGRYEPGLGPTGETMVYHLDVSEAVSDDLVGRLARADGSEAQAINARRCPHDDAQ